MIILDTNVLSALMRQSPEERIVGWLDRQPRTSVWTTAVTVLEIRFGLHALPVGKRRTGLLQTFDLLLDKMGQRVAAFDGAAAEHAATLIARRNKQGRPGDLRDTMIAGIVLATKATFATRNVDHFWDLPAVVNPWTS